MLGTEAERALVEWAWGGGGWEGVCDGGVCVCVMGAGGCGGLAFAEPVRSLGGGARHRVLHLLGRERASA